MKKARNPTTASEIQVRCLFKDIPKPPASFSNRPEITVNQGDREWVNDFDCGRSDLQSLGTLATDLERMTDSDAWIRCAGLLDASRCSSCLPPNSFLNAV